MGFVSPEVVSTESRHVYGMVMAMIDADAPSLPGYMDGYLLCYQSAVGDSDVGGQVGDFHDWNLPAPRGRLGRLGGGRGRYVSGFDPRSGGSLGQRQLRRAGLVNSAAASRRRMGAGHCIEASVARSPIPHEQDPVALFRRRLLKPSEFTAPSTVGFPTSMQLDQHHFSFPRQSGLHSDSRRRA